MTLAACVDTTDVSPTDDHATSDGDHAQREHGTLRIRDAYGEIHTVTVENVNGRAIYQGDMDLGPFSLTKERAYVSGSLGKRWANNTVRYKFQQDPAGCNGDPSCSCATTTGESCRNLTASEQQSIRHAMDEYERLTGLVFEESSTQPYIALTGWNKSGESRTFADSANQNSGFSTLIAFATNFSNGASVTDGGYRTAIHELGHALGFAHEQKRPDADDPSTTNGITLQPICMENPDAFETPSGSMKFLSPFDIDSMMLYNTWSFSRGDNDCSATKTTNCCPTMLGRTGTLTTFTYTNDTGSTITVDFEGSTYTMSANTSKQFTGHIIPRTPDFSAEDLNALYQMYPPAAGKNESGDRFGANAVSGDFNGDGYRDLAVAATHEGAYGHPTSGAVFIYRGTYTGLAPWTVIEEDSTGANEEADDRFGAGLAAVDLDNDGNDELVVGAPNKRTAGTNRSGGVYVFDTDRAGFTLRDYFFPNSLGYSNGVADDFGFAIDVAQENGATRVLVGAPGTLSDAGRVYVLRYDASASRHHMSGTGTFVAVSRMGTEQVANNRYGSAIASGQLDSDSYDEIVIGAPGASGSGKLFVFKGGSSFSFAGSVAKPGTSSGGEKFGRAIKLGKFRNLSSGKRQVAVSAPWEGTGRVYVLDLTVGSSSVTLDQSQTLVPSSSAGEFGYDLGAGDLNNDGITDLAIGAPETSGGFGGVWLFTGTGAAAPSVSMFPIAWTSFGSPFTHGVPGANDNFGQFVVVGNFGKQSGWKDLIVGAPGTVRDGQSDAGAIWAYAGTTGQTPQQMPDDTFTSFLDQESEPQK